MRSSDAFKFRCRRFGSCSYRAHDSAARECERACGRRSKGAPGRRTYYMFRLNNDTSIQINVLIMRFERKHNNVLMPKSAWSKALSFTAAKERRLSSEQMYLVIIVTIIIVIIIIIIVIVIVIVSVSVIVIIDIVIISIMVVIVIVVLCIVMSFELVCSLSMLLLLSLYIYTIIIIIISIVISISIIIMYMYRYMYVCVWIYIYINIHTHVHRYMCTYMYTYIHVYPRRGRRAGNFASRESARAILKYRHLRNNILLRSLCPATQQLQDHNDQKIESDPTSRGPIIISYH